MSDNWIPSNSFFKSFVDHSNFFPDLKVGDLLSTDLASWDHNKLCSYLAPIDVDRVTKVKIHSSLSLDQPCWISYRKGIFSIKLA